MAKAEVDSQSVVGVFSRVLADTQQIIDARDVETAVDIRVTFTSVTVSKGGVPVLWRKKKETTMELIFAARVVQRPGQTT